MTVGKTGSNFQTYDTVYFGDEFDSDVRQYTVHIPQSASAPLYYAVKYQNGSGSDRVIISVEKISGKKITYTTPIVGGRYAGVYFTVPEILTKYESYRVEIAPVKGDVVNMPYTLTIYFDALETP